MPCPEGYYLKSGACAACQIGSYNPNTGATQCISCAAPKTTLAMGANAETQCTKTCTVPQVDNVNSTTIPVSFVCLSVCPSVYLSVCLSICLSFCISVCLSVFLFVCLSVCLSACLSVCMSVCRSLSLCLPLCLSVCLYVCVSVCF